MLLVVVSSFHECVLQLEVMHFIVVSDMVRGQTIYQLFQDLKVVYLIRQPYQLKYLVSHCNSFCNYNSFSRLPFYDRREIFRNKRYEELCVIII